MQKQEAIDAICLHGFPSLAVASQMCELGLAIEDTDGAVDWSHMGLNSLDSVSLNQIYRALVSYEKPIVEAA